MSLANLGMAFEDGINKRSVDMLKRRGWRPRIIGLTGYGSVQSLHVMGRVIMGDPDATPESDPWVDVHGDGEATRPARYPALSDNAGEFLAKTAQEARRGWRQFFTAQVGHLPVTVRVNGREVATTTDRSGYIDVMVSNHGLEPGWHPVTLEAKAAEPTVTDALVVAPTTRVGIISDIDDTVMVTMLPRAALAAWNSFVRHTNTRKAVPGMAELYAKVLDIHPDAPIFYLSTGAWNVVPTLKRFMLRHGLPVGPMLMTDWGPTTTGLFRSGKEHKRVQLRNLMITFPHISWLLVGDDGQHDPMIYDDVAREHPRNVWAIGIRQLSPAEQVLAHGTLESAEMPIRGRSAATEHGVPTVHGKDGYALADELPAVLAAQRQRREQRERGEEVPAS
ncbi:App1 family protein [Georgenia sp. Z1344]|uniref:App1 family protein n=1 Tax=Georgenia sp. Z1344 TaxID=3416706 RepID=UPI003CEB1408